MKRYGITLLFSILVISLYYFVDLPFFDLDLNKMIKNSLFQFREKYVEEKVMIYNVGALQPNDLKVRIDSMLLSGSKIIGINLCHYDEIPNELLANYKGNDRVIFVNCSDGKESLSRVVNEGNVVTHFKTDRFDYFESLVTNFSGRGNEMERIHYGIQIYVKELNDDHWYFPSIIEDNIILLGYLGEYYEPDRITDYTSTRITPLNKYYGEEGIPPDMYDVEISATIIAMINNNDMLTEFPQWQRILILLGVCLVNVIILTATKTRWLLVNLLIAFILFMLLTAAGSLLMVYLFSSGYYLELDELPYMLLFTTVFTVGLDLLPKKNI